MTASLEINFLVNNSPSDPEMTVDFFTGDENPSNLVYKEIIEGMEKKGYFCFNSPQQSSFYETKNIVYLLCKKKNQDLEDAVWKKVPANFHFTNYPSVTIECPVNDKMDIEKQTLNQLIVRDKTITFSSGTETIIVNRLFLNAILFQKE